MHTAPIGYSCKSNEPESFFHPTSSEWSCGRSSRQPTTRILRVIARVSTLAESDVDALLNQVFEEFHGRHQKPKAFFERRFLEIRHHLLTDAPLSENRRLLLGAYFTQEYALESAALFNPSLVWHPDQTNLPKGSRRFAMSLRAVGEGHISSIVFRSGTIAKDLKINIDEPVKFVTTPNFVPDSRYDNDLFRRKLIELGLGTPFTYEVLSALANEFTLEQLEDSLKVSLREHRSQHGELAPLVEQVVMLAKSNYEIQYAPDHELSERVIFPFSPTETNGIEDARFVHFHDDDGRGTYYATYSAYDGKMVLPQLLGNHGLPSIQNAHAQRPSRLQQRNGAVSTKDQRALRDAWTTGRRAPVFDVLGHAVLLVHERADHQTHQPMGVSSRWATVVRRSKPKPDG